MIRKMTKSEQALYASFPFHVTTTHDMLEWHETVKPWLSENSTCWTISHWHGAVIDRHGNKELFTDILFKSSSEAMLFKLTFGGAA